MEYEPQRLIAGWSVGFFRQRSVWIALAILAAGAFCLRCLHLLDPNHYFIISPDSYFFHWVAGRVMEGQGPPPGASETNYFLHSGLAHPLAYISKAVSFVFNVPSAEALELVCKFLPPVLGVISLILVYMVAVKLYNRRVGLFSAFAWALMIQAIFIGAGGYLDRDGLNVLLMMIGAFAFYFSVGWRLVLGGKDIGWLAVGLAILALEAMLFLQWHIIGAALLLAIIGIYAAVQILRGIIISRQSKPGIGLISAFTARGISWRALAVIISGNIVVIVAVWTWNPNQIESWFRLAIDMFIAKGEGGGVQELQGISLRDLLIYSFFLVPMAVALYQTWKRPNNAAILLWCWFLLMLILSLFAKRNLIYGVPAACLLSGIGLAFIWEWRARGGLQTMKKVSAVALILVMVFVSFISATSLGTAGALAPDTDWLDGLDYLRNETPADAVIMTQWGWGYWILDLGQRTPVVDNGYYGRPSSKLSDVALVYMTTSAVEAVRLMEKYGADYFIFARSDQNHARTIMSWADPEEERQEFPADSLVERVLRGDFESEDRLEVVHRSAPNSSVVILRLNQSGES